MDSKRPVLEARHFLFHSLFAQFLRGLTFNFENAARVVGGFKRLAKAMDDSGNEENEEKVDVEARVIGFKG